MRRNLECYQCERLSIFMPAAGQCPYATTTHSHPAYSFIFSFDPTIEIIIEGEPVNYRLNEKNLIAMSPDILHQELPAETFLSYIAIVIEKEYFERVYSSYNKEIPVFKGNTYRPNAELLGFLKVFMLECGESDTSETNDVKNSLVLLICHLVVRSVLEESAAHQPIYQRFEVDKAISYMSTHIDEKITAKQLAEYVNLSESSFSRIFKQITNETPIRYLNLLRLKRAKAMLVGGEGSVTEIAIKCGFNSSSYFTSCFFEVYKVLPSSYIKQ